MYNICFDGIADYVFPYAVVQVIIYLFFQFMGITYLLSIIWLLMFTVLVVVTLFYTLAWFQCQKIPENQCIDYNQFGKHELL